MSEKATLEKVVCRYVVSCRGGDFGYNGVSCWLV